MACKKKVRLRRKKNRISGMNRVRGMGRRKVRGMGMRRTAGMPVQKKMAATYRFEIVFTTPTTTLAQARTKLQPVAISAFAANKKNNRAGVITLTTADSRENIQRRLDNMKTTIRVTYLSGG